LDNCFKRQLETITFSVSLEFAQNINLISKEMLNRV
jgi:hypothetical protein